MSVGSVGSEIVEQLRKRGAMVTTSSSAGMVLCNLTHDDTLNEFFFRELDGIPDGDVDPFVQPHFGNPSRVPEGIVSDVVSVLSTYACLADEAYTMLPPIIQAFKPFPVILGFSYPHAQLILAAVVERLENPGCACPNINVLPIGAFICVLEVTFSDAIFFILVKRR